MPPERAEGQHKAARKGLVLMVISEKDSVWLCFKVQAGTDQSTRRKGEDSWSRAKSGGQGVTEREGMHYGAWAHETQASRLLGSRML